MEEFVHIQKNLGHSPRKMRLVADMVRKLSPEAALKVLQFTNKAAAIDLSKAIKTALANTGEHKNHGLVFKTLEVNEGLKLKRYRVGTAGRGRGRPYQKRLSHVKIVLAEPKNEKGENHGTKD
ncbi:MAG: 50S ribosomal protein L22 [Candidatus Daviesbacteria bacterium GW2011_GWA2_38_24]|uniref:50S ribosomal protein L22 n=1 Tax=Candidatus Daviesbacteria bacterium GW2011_GWA2_38_24 TaxID=1618422 RepID=A0A0G0JWC8_9BACT|nr:MAG: 50S ribosomal protein L22 [Candidatus Daviesbacteria bacterium GW2011_GWA2_38_24]KKQ78397.1 MAG: 50S ribosomal protein L22 [Candidatus Daviesbacteria bacterium GW2011_GWA1_38_7]